MIIFYIFIFVVSFLILLWSGSRLVNCLLKVCYFLRWREFVVAFFVAIATSIPNLLLDVNAALQKIPELALGDIMGGNITDLTLVIGLAVLLSNVNLSTESRLVQRSAIFTLVIAIIPLVLIGDGRLDRIDGFICLLIFLVYSFWLFSKKERFIKVYDNNNYNKWKSEKVKISTEIKIFLKNIIGLFFFLIILLVASKGIILTVQYFSSYFKVSLPLIGILMIGFGNCAPEIYLILFSARKKQNWLILGNLMGSVIICATLVLGILALISPFEIKDFAPFFIARIFLIVSALIFFLMLRTGRRLSKLEGLFLIFIYFLFAFSEVYFK